VAATAVLEGSYPDPPRRAPELDGPSAVPNLGTVPNNLVADPPASAGVLIDGVHDAVVR
jgi:hypothetical protein